MKRVAECGCGQGTIRARLGEATGNEPGALEQAALGPTQRPRLPWNPEENSEGIVQERTALLCSTKGNWFMITPPNHGLDVARAFLLVKLPLGFIQMSIRKCICDAFDGMKGDVAKESSGHRRSIQ